MIEHVNATLPREERNESGFDTHPTAALMVYAPSVDREAPTGPILQRPLDSHIASAHDALAEVVQTVVHVAAGGSQQLLRLVRVVDLDACEEHLVCLADLAEAV